MQILVLYKQFINKNMSYVFSASISLNMETYYAKLMLLQRLILNNI
jgi:hypothetical protein